MPKNNKSTVGVFLGAGNVGRPSRGVKRAFKRIVRLPAHAFKLVIKLPKIARRAVSRIQK